MTKKDYILLAAAMRKIADNKTRKEVAKVVAHVCQGDNARFDRATFYCACELNN